MALSRASAYSFFSCKDRALERDRPYQRKKISVVHLLSPLFSSLFRLVCCLCASRVAFFSWCCGAPFFCCCCSVFFVGCRLCFFVLPVCLGCVRLSSGFALPSHCLLVSPLCLLVQSVLCWSLPPGICLYLQRSGCHTFDMACCGWLAPVFTPPHATKASALCGALPSLPCCGCCSVSCLCFFAGLRLLSSPRAPFLPCLVLPASLLLCVFGLCLLLCPVLGWRLVCPFFRLFGVSEAVLLLGPFGTYFLFCE